MGFRFRKSINFGGGVRVNVSKSGIGYSVGTKGVRVTKSAKGGIYGTVSASGTGISYRTKNLNSKGSSYNTVKTQNNANGLIEISSIHTQEQQRIIREINEIIIKTQKKIKSIEKDRF